MTPSQAPPRSMSAARSFGSRGVRLRVVAAVAVAFGAVACSADTEAGPSTESKAESSAPSGSVTPAPAEVAEEVERQRQLAGLRPGHPRVVTDPPEPVPAEAMLGLIDPFRGVTRADDGTTIVVSTNPSMTRSVYRLYDSRWRPLTPMLELPGRLSIDRGLAHAFVGSLLVDGKRGLPRVDEGVIVTRDGTLTAIDRKVGRGSEPVHMRPGDRLVDAPLPGVGPVQPGRMVYRPRDRTLHQVTVPEWDTLGHNWGVSGAGDICAVDSRERIGGTVHISVDEGRTFTDLSTSLVPAGSGPRLQSCQTAGDRVAIGTGGEHPKWLHVLDRASGALLASHYVGDQHGPYFPSNWQLLPDGKLVIGATGPGLYVATDPGNAVLEFRARPQARYAFPLVLGEDLALLLGAQRTYASGDEGRTWEQVDLEVPR